MTKLLITISNTVAISLWAGTATINIDATKPGPKVNPRMYGVFLEEINYGVDGGLYAELVANRAFEDSRPPEGFTLKGGRYKDEGAGTRASRFAPARYRIGRSCAKAERRVPCISKPRAG